MAKKILITGAFGQLGEAVVWELQPHFELMATGDHLPEKYLHLCEVDSIDVTDRKQCNQIINSFQPNVILHLASFTNVDGSETNKELAWNVNVKGTENLIISAKGRNLKFIYISSDYIFDGENGPYHEDSPPSPINYYGRSKLGGENVVRGGTVPWIIFRTNVLYGVASHTKASFVNWVVESLKARKSIRVVSDQWGNPTWTGGLAEAIKMAVILDIKGIFNYGGAEFLTRYEFAQKIAKVYDLDANLIAAISTDELNQAAKRPLKSGLKTEKIEETLGLRLYGVDYCLRKVKEGVVA